MSASVQEVAGADCKSILRLEGLPDESTVSYFSGSLVAGHGNAWSDIDVYAIGDRGPIGPNAFKQRTETVSVHFAFARRIDFEFWPRAGVAELADRLRDVQIGTPLQDELFSTAEEALIHRLKIGVTTHDQVQRFETLRLTFDFEKFRAYLVQKSLRAVDHLVEDVSGMMESKQFLTAVFTARSMVDFAVDAYCHSQGNTDPSKKWRIIHLQHYCRDDDIRSRYFGLALPASSLCEAEPGACRRYTDSCLYFINDIVDLVQPQCS